MSGQHEGFNSQTQQQQYSVASSEAYNPHNHQHGYGHIPVHHQGQAPMAETTQMAMAQQPMPPLHIQQQPTQSFPQHQPPQSFPQQQPPQMHPQQQAPQPHSQQQPPQSHPQQQPSQPYPQQQPPQPHMQSLQLHPQPQLHPPQPHSQPPQSVPHQQPPQALRPHIQQPSHSNSHPSTPQHLQPPIPQQFPMDQQSMPSYPLVSGPQNIPSGYPAHALPGNVGTMRFPNSANSHIQYQQHPNMDPRMPMEPRMPTEPRMPNMESRMPTMEPRMPTMEPRMSLDPRMPMQQMMPRPQIMLMPPNKNSITRHPQFVKQDTKNDEPSDTNNSPIQCHPQPSERQFYSQNEQIPQQQDFHQQYQPQYNYGQQQIDSNNAQVPYNPNYSSNQPPHIPTSGPPSSQQDPSMCQQVPSQHQPVQNPMPPFQQNSFPHPGMENSNRMPHPSHPYPNQLPMEHPNQIPVEQQNKPQEHMMGHQQGYPYQPPHINGENIQAPPHEQMRFTRPPGPFGPIRPPTFSNGQTRMGPPFHPPMPRQPGMPGQENFVARLPQQMPIPPQAQMAHPPQQPMQPPMMPSQMIPEQSAMSGQYNMQAPMLIHKHPMQQQQVPHLQHSQQPSQPPVSQQSENSESPQPQEILPSPHPQQVLQPRHPQMMMGPQRPIPPHMIARMPLQPGMIAFRNSIPMDPRFQNPQGFPIRPPPDMNRGSPNQLNRMPHPRMQHLQIDPQLETHHSPSTSAIQSQQIVTKEAKENMQMVPKGTIITTCSSPAMMNPTSIMIPPNAMAQHMMKADPSLQGPGVPVPWGWKRLILQDRVVYFSPSGIELKTHEEIKEYLATEGTCKCGLECPLLVDVSFDFNTQKPSALWMPSPMVIGSNSSQCCQHKNSILTKAQLQSTPGLGFRLKHFHNPIFNNTQDGKRKVKKKKKPFSNVLVSQMLAAREAEKVRINEIIAQQKQQHEAKLHVGNPSTSGTPPITSTSFASTSQATDNSGMQVTSESGPQSIALTSTKVHSGAVSSSFNQRPPQPIQAISRTQVVAKTTSSQIQNHPRRPSTEIINPFVVSSTKPVQLALSNGKLMEVEPTSKSHSSSSQTAIANLGTNTKDIPGNSSGRDEKSGTETQANISKAVKDDQCEINKTPCDMEDSDYKNTVSGHVAGKPTNAILANLPNDQSTKGKEGGVKDEINADELGKEQHSDVAKNIEIRRLSATEEGNKVLEPTFNSPEKDKKKNPLGNILDIVSGIEMPPAFKMLDENESRIPGRSRNSSPALSGSSSPGMAGIRPQLKGRKNRQYSSLPPLPHSPPPWVLGGPSLAHGQNMPPLISVDQIRGLRPSLPAQSQMMQSPQGGLIQGSVPGSNNSHLMSSSTPQMMVMSGSGMTTSAPQMMVMSGPTTSSPPMMVMSGPTTSTPPMMVMSGPTTSTPQMMVMSGPTMTTSAPQMMVMSGPSMTTSAPQMMVMSGPTMQVSGSQQNMQPLMQLVQTINGPMLMPMGSQPITMDNNTVILQQQHPTPNFIQQPSPQITPTPSPVTLSLSPGSATQLSPGPKKKSRKRKAPAQSPSTPSPIAPSPSTVPILMSPNGNIMSLQPIQGSQSSPTGGQVLTISQGSPGSNLIATGPSQTVQQLMPQNILLNQAGSQMILSNGTLMTVPQPQGIMYQQLPDGTLLQVQNTHPMPIIQQGGQQIFTQGTLPGQLVLQGNQLIMTQSGIVQAQGPIQGDMVTINAQRQIVGSQQSTTIVTKPKENSRKPRPKKKQKEEKAKTPPEPVNYEGERVNSPEQDSTDENDGSFEEPKPSTSKENSPKSNIQSNKVDSSGLNATPPHLRDFETLRSKSPFGSDIVTSFNDPDRSMDLSRESNSSGNTTPRSNVSLIDEKEEISEDEESNGEDEDDDEEDDDEEEEDDVEEDEEEGEGENRSPKLVTSSMHKKKKRSADDFLQEQNQFFDEDTHQDSPAPPPESRDLKIGDLVWGPVNGFPSWPGKLVRDEGLGVTRSKDKDMAWVCWFGNRQVSQVEVHRLKTLTEGLEAHHRERKKLRKGRKMNSSLEKAIQEAMLELD